LEIALSGDDPIMVAALVNAVTTAYLDEVVNVDHVERQRRFEGLKEIWKKYESDLRRKREQLRAIAEAIGSDDKKALTLQKQYEIDRQDLVRRNLIEVHGELLKRRAELEFAGERNERVLNGPGRQATEEAIEAELLNDPAIAQHLENIRRYKEEIMQQSRIVRNPGSDPGTSSIRMKIREEEIALSKRRKTIRPFIASQLLNVNVADKGTARNIEALRDQVAMLERLESQYQHELQSIKEETRNFYGKSFDFGLLQDEVELDEKAAREVGDELRHVELELNQAPPRIKTFEKAKVPRVKDQGRKVKISLMSGGAAFLLIVLAITFWEYQAQRVGFAHDVVQTTGMGVVGTLPALASRSRENLALGRKSAALLRANLLLESIDTTRLMLLRATQAESLRVVMIASAVSGEGKTSLASHLAVSLSRSGRRTLLLDSDIRKPNLHQIFEAPLAPGLCEHLRGEVELSDAIRPTPIGNLALMSAGNIDDKALTLLAQRDLRPMFNTLRNEFDFVIVDSSPILSVADPLLVGLQVDAVVFAVMNNLSRIPDVFKAHNRLIALGVRVLGAVVAGTREGLSSSVYTCRNQRKDREVVS
jgi:capsular exopolysaccharide synthesis family protein